jgi:hypothetical protein
MVRVRVRVTVTDRVTVSEHLACAGEKGECSMAARPGLGQSVRP